MPQLGIDTVIMTGTAGDSCVLASGFDARMRDFDVVIPRDGIDRSPTAQSRCVGGDEDDGGSGDEPGEDSELGFLLAAAPQADDGAS